MKSIVQMVLVLTVLSGFSAGILSGIRVVTMDKIEYQQLKFQKEPAVRKIMEGSTIDPMDNRYKVDYMGKKLTVFPGVIDGERVAAFEAFGKGYSGDVGLMVGMSLETGNVVGMGVTTHSETPGIGSKAKEDPSFVEQFSGLNVESQFKVRNDGGDIDSISGATITSRAVCVAANEAGKAYTALKDALLEKKIDAKEGSDE